MARWEVHGLRIVHDTQNPARQLKADSHGEAVTFVALLNAYAEVGEALRKHGKCKACGGVKHVPIHDGGGMTTPCTVCVEGYPPDAAAALKALEEVKG